MPNIPNTTRAQTRFLRAFHSNPLGPPPQDWPSPAILRRWLRHDTFRWALDSIRRTHHYCADLHLAAATSAAARLLFSALASSTASSAPDPDQLPSPERLRCLTRLLYISHLRQRTPIDDRDNYD